MIQPSQREKLLIIITGAVLFVVVSWFLWVPLFHSWRDTTAMYRMKQDMLTLERDTLREQQQPQFKKDYAELVKGQNNPNGPAPVPDVLQKVEQLAQDAGVNLQRRNPQPSHDKGGFTEVAFDFSMEGSLESIVHFLCEVKDTQSLMDVTELKITPSSANPAVLRVELHLVSLGMKER